MVAVIRFQDATVVRSGRPILDSVTWEVHDDERWVVLGPNGAGKTTMLQLAAAQIHPTHGAVDVLGERLGAVDVFGLRPRIGLTSAALAEHLPGDELVRDVAVTAAWAVVGRGREEYEAPDLARAMTVLRLAGADHLAGRRFGTLSEGERKRVQIARALMTDPELLLLDEPAAGLDLGGREELVTRLSSIALDPWAPAQVLVTHHVEEIPPGFSHALLLRDGRVVTAGPVPQVITGRNLTATFGTRLRAGHVRGRYWARAAPSDTVTLGRRGARREVPVPQQGPDHLAGPALLGPPSGMSESSGTGAST